MKKVGNADLARDISGLGGLPAFALVAALALVTGHGASALAVLIALVLGYGFAIPLKLSYFRPRPRLRPFNTRLERYDANSFPSIHAMRGAALWTVVALERCDLGVVVVCLSTTAAIGWSRVALREHHPRDVAVGLLLGMAAAAIASAIGPY